MIEQLSYKDSKSIKEIRLIHKSIMPSSIVAILGNSFMVFYYDNMLKDDSFFCNVYRHNGKIAGFITFSNNSDGILLRAIRKKILRFGFVLLMSVIKNPRKLKAIVASAAFVILNQGRILPKIKAEVIAFAVLPECRRKKIDENKKLIYTQFYKKFRIDVGKELFASAISQLKKMNAKEVKIQADKSNKVANRFYSKCSCSLAETRFSFMGSKLNVYRGQVDKVLGRISK